MKITDEQVLAVLKEFYPSAPKDVFDTLEKCDMRRALEAAFPDEQPAAFGKLVVSEEMAAQANDLWQRTFSIHNHSSEEDDLLLTCYQTVLQSFVDAHSIKPIAFADRMPEKDSRILVWNSLNNQWVVCCNFDWKVRHEEFTHWLPASALPIPEPALVDPKEECFNKVMQGQDGQTVTRKDLEHVWQAAQQAGGAKCR
jgi:hypothetical protein